MPVGSGNNIPQQPPSPVVARLGLGDLKPKGQGLVMPPQRHQHLSFVQFEPDIVGIPFDRRIYVGDDIVEVLNVV
ncbi:hypothetical protein D3C80_1902490 [compost metagenome]